jgi:RNA recognition motif-containing protein
MIDLYSKTGFSSGGFDMSTRIHVSGLSYFCTDDKLRQAFTPFGTVVLAQVLRDECGHSLGLGIVHMACSEDVERVFNEQHRFEISGSRVDLWEPAEPEDSPGERIVSYNLRGKRAAQTGQDKGQEKSQEALQPLALRRFGLIRNQEPSSGAVKR